MPVNADSNAAGRTAKAVLLIRLLVGWVFVSEGIQKFLFADTLGVGRFVKIGIPWPQVMAPFVGVVEIVFGSLPSLVSSTNEETRGSPRNSLNGCRTQSGLPRTFRCIPTGRHPSRLPMSERSSDIHPIHAPATELPVPSLAGALRRLS